MADESVPIQSLEEIDRQSPFNIYNGIRTTVFRENYCEVEVDLVENAKNFQGIAHGGLIYTICDDAGGIASGCTVPPYGVTLCSNISFLMPGSGTKLIAKATVVRAGHTIRVADVDVYNDINIHIAHATFQYYMGK